jgi:hypothetical protein
MQGEGSILTVVLIRPPPLPSWQLPPCFSFMPKPMMDVRDGRPFAVGPDGGAMWCDASEPEHRAWTKWGGYKCGAVSSKGMVQETGT